MAALSRQGVLYGDVDYCCLICGQTFTDCSLVSCHVASAAHTDGFAATAYLESHAGERIRKIKTFYFCEACNRMLASSRKVTQHVNEETHRFNRSLDEETPRGHPYRRLGGAVVAFEDVLIDEAAWNGIVDGCCIVCDVDLEDVKEHIQDSKHVIKLIESKVNSGNSNSLYRKIDATLFQCLTCNTTVPQNSFVEHWDSPEHTTLHLKSRKAKREADANQNITKVFGANTEVISNKNVPKEQVSKVTDASNNTNNLVTAKQIGTPKFNNTSKETNKVSLSNKDENIGNAQEKKPLNGQQPSEQIGRNNNIELSNKNVKDSQPAVKKSLEPKVNPNTPKNDETKYLYGHLDEELGTKSYLYMEGNGKLMCILCNWCMDPRASTVHIQSAHHRLIEKLHEEDLKKRNEKVKAELLKSEKEVKQVKVTANDPDDEDSLIGIINVLRKEKIEVNFFSKTIFCKLCNKDLAFNVESARKHIEFHNDTENRAVCKKEEYTSSIKVRCEDDLVSIFTSVLDLSSIDDGNVHKKSNEGPKHRCASESKDTYKENSISCVEGNPKAFCQVCNIELPSLQKCLDEHIIGTKHKKNLAKRKVEVTTAKQPLKATDNLSKSENNPVKEIDMLKDVVQNGAKATENDTAIDGPVDESAKSPKADSPSKPQGPYTTLTMEHFVVIWKLNLKDCIINNSICVNILSYCLCEPLLEFMTCRCCNEMFSRYDFEFHVNSSPHKRKMAVIPVLVSLGDEFVREPRPALYHCGYCDVALAGWAYLEEHLRGAAHAKGKGAAAARLARQREPIPVTVGSLTMMRAVNQLTGRTYF